MKKIGNVLIDDSCYKGSDLYTDGPVEDELLDIAESFRGEEEDLNQIIAERASWPVLYHFSHVRQNITDWLPIKGTDKVLEIGAGCGAITGSLARKAGSVECIDLSMKRSEINANRNKEFRNIRIRVGNFLDIEKVLTEKYDYITLIGVFEYSEAYMGEKEPYKRMLNCIKKHLAPEGRIVIAIENKLGLKYFAGCTEDHIGKYFEGIEGYPGSSGVKTFSKKELSDLLDSVGLEEKTFYYPYPDYKLPMTIYSDEMLPKPGEIQGFAQNFDRERIALFSEPKAWDSIIDAGLFGELSNSFLIIAGEQENASEKVLYSKFSNERSSELSIRTDIVEVDKERKVRKIPMPRRIRNTRLAHVSYITQIEKELNEQYRKIGYVCNRGTEISQGIELEYLKERTLEEKLDAHIHQGEISKAEEELMAYLKKIEAAHDEEVFTMTTDFRNVFGDISLPENLKCGKLTNIDLVCQNIVLTETPTVIDYEWTYRFPIPALYVIYRTIVYFTDSGMGRPMIGKKALLERFQINEELADKFAQMEKNFQSSITEGHTPIRDMYDRISPGVADFSIERKRTVQVFFDTGEGYSEEQSVRQPIIENRADFELALPLGCLSVRIDPDNCPCSVYVKDILVDGQRADLVQAVIPNGSRNGKWIWFTDHDPNISNINLPANSRRLKVRLAVFENDQRAMEKNVALVQENERLKQELADLKAPIHKKLKKTYRNFKERKNL